MMLKERFKTVCVFKSEWEAAALTVYHTGEASHQADLGLQVQLMAQLVCLVHVSFQPAWLGVALQLGGQEASLYSPIIQYSPNAC